jgi:hypothetical protein
MSKQAEQLIAHANKLAKANFMQFDYDEDNPITDLLQAVLVIAFDNDLPDEVDHDMQPVYDELSKGKTPTEREQVIEKLSTYISEDNTEEALDKLQSAKDKSVIADDIVIMWEPLENKFSVDELLEEIGL